MANNFSKEERVMFENALMGFHDALVLSKAVDVESDLTDTQMERVNDSYSRPMPYILNSQDRVIGTPVTSQDTTQLKVPIAVDQQKTAPFTLTATELRDKYQDGSLGKAAYQRLATDIDLKVKEVASVEGSLVHTVSNAANYTYDDIAGAEALMLEQGMSNYERCLAIPAREYNKVAGDLSKASRSFGNKKSDDAYEKSFIGDVAGFDCLKLDAGYLIGAAQGSGITMATNGAQVRYAPTSTADNRRQTVTFSSTTGMAAGDAFTVAGIEAVHHITKQSTGQPKTFRVIEVVNGTQAVISPPMIGANSSPTDAETQYQNINVDSTSATAAVSFLNTNAIAATPFWLKQSICITPSRYDLPDGAGLDIMKETTENGIEIMMAKSASNSTLEVLYTFDVRYGVTNLNPEQNGIILFGQ